MDFQALVQAVEKFGHNNSGPFFLGFVAFALFAWTFFCWCSSRQKVYDVRTGRTRYEPKPYEHTPFISFPPTSAGL